MFNSRKYIYIFIVIYRHCGGARRLIPIENKNLYVLQSECRDSRMFDIRLIIPEYFAPSTTWRVNCQLSIYQRLLAHQQGVHRYAIN